MITIFDWETTGLVGATGRDLIHQPHVTEFYGIQIGNKFEIIKEYGTLIKPPIPIPEYLHKQGIGPSNDQVRNAPIFIEVYKKIMEIFWKSHTMVAHNLSFDLEILVNELRRIGKEYHFPYPPIHFCTVEQSMHLKGYRLKNSELYKITTGKDLEGSHIAKNDVLATFESYKWLKEQERKMKKGKKK